MASSEEYLRFILEQLADVENIRYRAMMGEYILYYKDKIIGGIYDDRLLVKDIPTAEAYLQTAKKELPYEGAKPMLLVEELDDKHFLKGLFKVIDESLPPPKKKQKKK